MASGYRHLRSLDAAFLHLESPRTPMHTTSIAVFEGGPFFDHNGRFRLAAVRRHVEERLRGMPGLRSIVRFARPGGGHPVWVEDSDFDVARHVQLAQVAPPADAAALYELAVRLNAVLLDRTRPLWEVWLVPGLEGGRVALVEKIHHALADGVSDVTLATALLDDRRHPRRARRLTMPLRLDPPASAQALALDDLRGTVALPLRAGASLVGRLADPLGSLARARSLLSGVATLMTPRIVAPRSSLNNQVTAARQIEVVRVDLDEVKAVEHRFGVTVNDVVLTAVAGGLRRVLERRGEAVERLGLRVLVPVSVRREAVESELGNRVSAMFVTLPLHRDDPVGRLRLVQAEVASLKSRGQTVASKWLLDLTGRWPQVALEVAAWAVHHQPFVNLVVTNVPGPQYPLYLMGAEMLDVVPIVPLGGNLTVGVAAFSYRGQLSLGLHGDPAAFPELSELALAIRAAFSELRDAADGRYGVGNAHRRVPGAPANLGVVG